MGEMTKQLRLRKGYSSWIKLPRIAGAAERLRGWKIANELSHSLISQAMERDDTYISLPHRRVGGVHGVLVFCKNNTVAILVYLCLSLKD